MSLSSDKDKKIAKAESEAKRQKAKSGRPDDNYGERYVTGMEGLRTQGKGSKVRDSSGWYSDDVTQKLNKIFKQRQEEYINNSDITPIPYYEEKEKTK